MIDITIKRGSENLSGKWNGKFYYSDKKKLFRKIYINYEDKESQDIHLSQKEYLALLQTQEAFIKQEDIQIKLKIFKLFEKLSLKARKGLIEELQKGKIDIKNDCLLKAIQKNEGKVIV